MSHPAMGICLKIPMCCTAPPMPYAQATRAAQQTQGRQVCTKKAAGLDFVSALHLHRRLQLHLRNGLHCRAYYCQHIVQPTCRSAVCLARPTWSLWGHHDALALYICSGMQASQAALPRQVDSVSAVIQDMYEPAQRKQAVHGFVSMLKRDFEVLNFEDVVNLTTQRSYMVIQESHAAAALPALTAMLHDTDCADVSRESVEAICMLAPLYPALYAPAAGPLLVGVLTDPESAIVGGRRVAGNILISIALHYLCLAPTKSVRKYVSLTSINAALHSMAEAAAPHLNSLLADPPFPHGMVFAAVMVAASPIRLLLQDPVGFISALAEGLQSVEQVLEISDHDRDYLLFICSASSALLRLLHWLPGSMKVEEIIKLMPVMSDLYFEKECDEATAMYRKLLALEAVPALVSSFRHKVDWRPAAKTLQRIASASIYFRFDVVITARPRVRCMLQEGIDSDRQLVAALLLEQWAQPGFFTKDSSALPAPPALAMA